MACIKCKRTPSKVWTIQCVLALLIVSYQPKWAVSEQRADGLIYWVVLLLQTPLLRFLEAQWTGCDLKAVRKQNEKGSLRRPYKDACNSDWKCNTFGLGFVIPKLTMWLLKTFLAWNFWAGNSELEIYGAVLVCISSVDLVFWSLTLLWWICQK